MPSAPWLGDRGAVCSFRVASFTWARQPPVSTQPGLAATKRTSLWSCASLLARSNWPRCASAKTTSPRYSPDSVAARAVPG
eukprot:1249357-Prymnesium_polylepis.2